MEHFWKRIAKAGENDCWPWMGSRNKKMGYGHFSYWENGKGRSTTAHRKAWELAKGPIPEGLHVLHRCDNPPCCNPEHLFLGTHRDNMNDKVAKGRQSRLGQPRRTHCVHGHEFTPETTMFYGRRKVRRCRICHNARSLEAYHRQHRRGPK